MGVSKKIKKKRGGSKMRPHTAGCTRQKCNKHGGWVSMIVGPAVRAAATTAARALGTVAVGALTAATGAAVGTKISNNMGAKAAKKQQKLEEEIHQRRLAAEEASYQKQLNMASQANANYNQQIPE